MYVHMWGGGGGGRESTLLLYVAYFIGLIRISTTESLGHFPEEKPVSAVVLSFGCVCTEFCQDTILLLCTLFFHLHACITLNLSIYYYVCVLKSTSSFHLQN